MSQLTTQAQRPRRTGRTDRNRDEVIVRKHSAFAAHG